MNILILGSGAREHSIAWAVKQNPKCSRLLVAPGNAGIADIADISNINIENYHEVVKLATQEEIDFIIIGPEAPLAAGVSDELKNKGFLVFGPTKSAAQLEISKSFMKDICTAAGIPTANHSTFDNHALAKKYVSEQGTPIVVKADGLAAGKGVTVAMDLATAYQALDDIFSSSNKKNMDEKVVIEEFMEGEEASFFILCDGQKLLPMGTAQDHKRVGDGDTGPNTGGMGAYSPAPVLTKQIQETVIEEIVKPTLIEMERRGQPYQGVLYAGLMINNGQARLVEYNVRFGDPECQALMMRLGAQVLDLLIATSSGDLENAQINWANDHALCVVMASNGYPGKVEKGSIITGLQSLTNSSSQMCFHAGTKKEGENIVANSGRVLSLTTRCETLAEAQKLAYEMVKNIDWQDGFCRSDIGWRAL
jgi:phosphoribosylamine--glycine ligase